MSGSNLVKRVFEYIKRERLVSSGDTVLAAVSGGADSVCLLLVLKELEAPLEIHVEAVTVNHGIRGESAARDVEFVRGLCTDHGIPVHVCRVDVPELVKREQLSEEEAARRARYECFGSVAGKIGAGVIAVAHHRDDNCETVLHHLFRGSSLRGLGGMAPRRRMQEFYIIRPFLELGRQEIENWLMERGISWCTDETNLEDNYTRNRLRRHVIPMVEKEINDQASAHVVQAASYIAQAQNLIEEMAFQWLDLHGIRECGNNKVTEFSAGCCTDSGDSYRLPAGLLQSCHPVIRREILIQACRKVTGGSDLKDVGHVHLEMLERLAEGETSRRLELPGGIRVKKEYDMLVFQAPTSACENDKKENLNNKMPPEQIVLSDGNIIENSDPQLAKGISFRIFSYNGEKIPENNYTKWFDYDTIKNGLSLRTRRTGDYFLLDGGGRKTVKSYMIDRKIPADRRDSVLLLAQDSHVLWLSDGRISAAYKVNRNTHNVLELTYLKEERLS